MAAGWDKKWRLDPCGCAMNRGGIPSRVWHQDREVYTVVVQLEPCVGLKGYLELLVWGAVYYCACVPQLQTIQWAKPSVCRYVRLGRCAFAENTYFTYRGAGLACPDEQVQPQIMPFLDAGNRAL